MKKLLLTVVAGTMAALGFGQSLQILDGNNNSLNGQTVDLWYDVTMPSIFADFPVKNIATSAKYIKAKRYEISVVPGTNNLLCWLACYAPSISVSPAVNLAADSTHTFSSHYYPNGQLGTTVLRYTFWDSLNTADSAQFTINWHITPAGVNNIHPVTGSVNIYPNPASGNTTISFKLSNTDHGTIKLFNYVGSEVKRLDVDAAYGNAVINVSDLEPGIYFCSILVDDKIILTRKLTVTR